MRDALDALARAPAGGRGVLVVLLVVLSGCPARKHALTAPASPTDRARPRPCAELTALLVEGRPPRALVLQLTGRGRGECEVKLEDLKLQYRPTSSTLANVKLPRRPASLKLAPNVTRRLRFVVRLPSDPPGCRVTLSGKQYQTHSDERDSRQYRAPISQPVGCGAEVAR